MDFIEHIKQIIELSKNCGLTDSFFRDAKKDLSYVNRKAKLTCLETVFFSHFLNNADHSISIFDIGKQLNLDNLETMKYLDVIESLEKKKCIQKVKNFPKKENQTQYTIPIQIQKKVGTGNFSIPKTEGLSTEELFDHLQRVFDEWNDDELEYNEFEAEILGMIEKNGNLVLIKKIEESNLSNEEKILFIKLYLEYFESGDNEFNVSLVDRFSHNAPWRKWRELRTSLSFFNHKLFSMNVLDVVNKSGFGDKNYFCFSRDMLEIINSELNIEMDFGNKNNRKGLLQYEDIKEKIMFYNDREERKLEELFLLLDEDNFKRIQDRLSGNGMRTGFACLFSGPPGTGKTESVYQIARKTKRDIMLIDISETKSKWFSESEKLTKAIFTRYRKLLDENVKAPILFFNEADAVFSKRRQLEETRNGPEQTENAIQNILLQEMENLNGILICTSNLIKNLDKAFERRFLYKIEFEKPSPNVRQKIWKSMIPELSGDDAAKLSASYDFSGGQIENIARKRSVEIVLNGEEPSLDEMMEFCRDELLVKEEVRCIGFGR